MVRRPTIPARQRNHLDRHRRLPRRRHILQAIQQHPLRTYLDHSTQTHRHHRRYPMLSEILLHEQSEVTQA